MNADISRDTFQPQEQYTRVVAQQGRPLVDSDFNEQTDILLHLMRQFVRDVMGECCAVDKTAFELTRSPQPAGIDFQIGPGRMYVHGIACECPWQTDPGQPPRHFAFRDQFGPSELESMKPPPPAGWCIVYLDVWDRSETAATNPGLAEQALGGGDTAARTWTCWRVRMRRVTFSAELPAVSKIPQVFYAESERFEGLTASRGVARFRLARAGGAAPGYTGAENNLYRVEVHQVSNKGYPLQVKYSRNNGTTVFPVENLKELKDGQFQLTKSSLAGPTLPAIGDWAELLTEHDQRRRDVGALGEIRELDPRSGRGQINTSDKDYYRENEAFIRCWDGVATFNPETAESWVHLVDDIEVFFEAGKPFTPGDYWLVPARVGHGLLVEEDTPVKPDGPVFHQVPIGLIRVKVENEVASVVDAKTLRPLWKRTEKLSWPDWSEPIGPR